ncbi:hypothetical protein ACTXT7_006988 [Hymenolepis weldensis]
MVGFCVSRKPFLFIRNRATWRTPKPEPSLSDTLAKPLLVTMIQMSILSPTDPSTLHESSINDPANSQGHVQEQPQGSVNVKCLLFNGDQVWSSGFQKISKSGF